MRILVLTDEIFPDAIGGVGKSLYNECVALAKRGHQINVLVRALNPDLPPRSEVAGLEIIRFYGPKRGSKAYYLYPLSIVIQVRRWLRAHGGQWDVISVHNSIFILAARLAGAHRDAPVIYTFYASIADEIRISAGRGKYGRWSGAARIAAGLLGRLERWGLARVRAVLPRSIYTLEVVRRIYPAVPVPNADKLIPLGVDPSLYRQMDITLARAALDLSPDVPILITARRLEGRMGLPSLIRAAALVRQRFPDLRLLIAGRGYLRPTLESLIAELGLGDVVDLLGFVPEEKLPIYLSAADLFVLPTESLEGFGLATIEAMAVGLPVVGTPIGATPELLERVDPSLLTRDSSPEALAERITYWLERPQELRELRQRAYEVVQQTYAANQVAAQLEALYQTIAASNRAAR